MRALQWRPGSRQAARGLGALVLALGLGGGLASSAPARAQAWLPAARDAAASELAAELGYTGPVTLVTPSVTPLDPPVAGVSGRYRTAVAGTSWLAWGLLDEGGAVVLSALARTSDPPTQALFAHELATFRAGTASSPFFDLVQYLGAHAEPPAALLSTELRQSTLRAILDLYHADPGRPIGLFGDIAQPFALIFRQGDFPAALIARDVGRIRAEWDLADPRQPESLAFAYQALDSALYLRGRTDAAVLPLLSDLVETITAADRSLHPAFQTLLALVAGYHLYLRPAATEPVLPGRDPLVLYGFLTA